MTLPVLIGAHADEVVIVDPQTGEALSVYDATHEQIARWRRAVLDWEQAARQAKKAVDAVVIARMDEAAEWTLRAGRFVLSAPSPAPSIDYPDPEALRRDLLALPGLAPAAIDRAVRPVTIYKPQVGGIKKLRALQRADVDACLDAHSVASEKDRRLSVKEAA